VAQFRVANCAQWAGPGSPGIEYSIAHPPSPTTLFSFSPRFLCQLCRWNQILCKLQQERRRRSSPKTVGRFLFRFFSFSKSKLQFECEYSLQVTGRVYRLLQQLHSFFKLKVYTQTLYPVKLKRLYRSVSLI